MSALISRIYPNRCNLKRPVLLEAGRVKNLKLWYRLKWKWPAFVPKMKKNTQDSSTYVKTVVKKWQRNPTASKSVLVRLSDYLNCVSVAKNKTQKWGNHLSIKFIFKEAIQNMAVKECRVWICTPVWLSLSCSTYIHRIKHSVHCFLGI